jgi:uncharacterized membrane protein YphA (DoxX/SURF4 family)
MSHPPLPLPPQPTSARPRWLPAIARVLLGLPLFIFGLNGFLSFIPPPEVTMPEDALAFVTALVNSGYLMPLIALTHLIVGLLLLIPAFPWRSCFSRSNSISPGSIERRFSPC